MSFSVVPTDPGSESSLLRVVSKSNPTSSLSEDRSKLYDKWLLPLGDWLVFFFFSFRDRRVAIVRSAKKIIL